MSAAELGLLPASRSPDARRPTKLLGAVALLGGVRTSEMGPFPVARCLRARSTSWLRLFSPRSDWMISGEIAD